MSFYQDALNALPDCDVDLYVYPDTDLGDVNLGSVEQTTGDPAEGVEIAEIIRRARPIDPRGLAAAACRGVELKVFFGPGYREHPSDRESREALAREICAGCKVQPECLDYTLQFPDPFPQSAIIAGTDNQERTLLRALGNPPVYAVEQPAYPDAQNRRFFDDDARRKIIATSALNIMIANKIELTLDAISSVLGVHKTTIDRLFPDKKGKDRLKHIRNLALEIAKEQDIEL